MSARSRSRTRWRSRAMRRRSAPTASSPSRRISGRRRVEAIDDYFVRLCTSIDLPVLSYNSPSYLAGVEITGDLMARLIERLPNFVGVKEASFNSEKFLEISRAALTLRPNFAMLTGVEFLLPSVPLGGVGSYSAAGSICPNLCTRPVRRLHRRRMGAGARAAIQDDAAVAPVQRPISLLAQGRHGDHGPPRRPDARRRCRPPRQNAKPISAASSKSSASSTPSRTAGECRRIRGIRSHERPFSLACAHAA